MEPAQTRRSVAYGVPGIRPVLQVAQQAANSLLVGTGTRSPLSAKPSMRLCFSEASDGRKRRLSIRVGIVRDTTHVGELTEELLMWETARWLEVGQGSLYALVDVS